MNKVDITVQNSLSNIASFYPMKSQHSVKFGRAECLAMNPGSICQLSYLKQFTYPFYASVFSSAKQDAVSTDFQELFEHYMSSVHGRHLEECQANSTHSINCGYYYQLYKNYV